MPEYEKHPMSSHSTGGTRIATDARTVSHRHALSPPGIPHGKVRLDTSHAAHYTSSLPKKKMRRDDGPLPPRVEKNLAPSDRGAPRKPGGAPQYSPERDRDYSRPRSHYPPHQHPDGYGLPLRPKDGRPAMEPGYSGDPVESNRSRGHQDNYPPGKGKHYNVPLTDRFPSAAGSLNDSQRVQFSREDLENITIDIKRNLRNYSPTVRRIINPADVKLVRRPTEGHHPIFDRQEIKRAARPLPEESFSEHKSYGSSESGRPHGFPLNYKDMENYEITRSRLEGQFHSGNTNTLNDRWHGLDNTATRSTERGESTRAAYPSRHQGAPGYAESRRPNKNRSPDADYRPVSEQRGRPEYPPSGHKALPANPTDLRHNLAIRRKEGSVHDARERLMQRRAGERDHPAPYPTSSTGPVSTVPPMRARSRSGSRGYPTNGNKRTRTDSPYGRARSSERMNIRAGEIKEYDHKSSRYKYDSWNEKSNDGGRSSSFHAERGNYHNNAAPRFASRGMRGRGFRARPFRGGSLRGSSFRGRGSFRNSISPRGRAYPMHRKLSGSYKFD